jgi:RNA polymerase sigma factor (sigma-70 family)
MLFTVSDIEGFRRRLRCKISRKIGFGSSDVEDLVQETIFRFLVATRAGRLRNAEGSGAYLYGICQNVILEYLRGASREDQLRSDHPEPVNPGLSEAERLELEQLSGMLMHQLSPRDRFVLNACYLQELSRKELVAATGMTSDQLRVVLCRARKRCRGLLACA